MVEDDVLGRNVNDLSLPTSRFGSDNPDIDALIGFDRFGQSAADKVSHPCDGKRGLTSLVRGSFLLRPRFDLEPGDRIENLARKCPCKLMKLGNHLPQIAKALDGLVIRDAPGIHSILPMIVVSPCVVLGDLMHVLVRDDLREDPCGVLVAVAPLPHLILVLPFHLVLPSLLHDLWHIANLYMGDVADPERRRYFGRVCRNTIELLDPGDQFLERPGQEALDRNIGQLKVVKQRHRSFESLCRGALVCFQQAGLPKLSKRVLFQEGSSSRLCFVAGLQGLIDLSPGLYGAELRRNPPAQVVDTAAALDAVDTIGYAHGNFAPQFATQRSRGSSLVFRPD